MSDPQSAGYAGMFTTMAGGLQSAIGGIMGGQAQQAMYNYQAGIARLNQTIAYQNANYARQVGELQAQRAGMTQAQQQGQTVAALASHGLDIRSGSAAATIASQKLVGQMDLATIRSDAAKTAYNYEVQGVQYGAQAQLDTVAGQNARSAGLVSGMSSIVGAASSVSSEWLRGQQLGLWGGSNQSFGQ